jgi:hypothetical protein
LDGPFDGRPQRSSAIGTITLPGMQVRITVIGGDGYERIDRGHDAGRWLKYPLQQFRQFTLAGFASNPFSGYGPAVCAAPGIEFMWIGDRPYQVDLCRCNI